MPDKKLLLVYPNQRWYKDDPNTVWNLNPYTLCLLGAMVKDEVRVKIIDAQFYNMSPAEFTAQVKDYNPDFVGISILASEYSEILGITAAAVKQMNPSVVIIAGGVHVTMEYQRVMEDPNIDYAVRGEGEYVLRDLLRYLQNSGPLPGEGLVYRKDGELVALEQSFVEDLTRLPRADYSLVKMEDYVMSGLRLGPIRPPAFPYAPMIVTRGCPFGCSFCQVESVSGRKVRARDPRDVIDELLFLKQNYGIQSIIFEDDNIIMARSFFVELLKLMIANQLNLKFVIGAFAIFLLTDEILELMVRAGCVGVNVAIESGTQRVLKEIVGKPVDLEKAVEMIAKVRSRGLYCLANFIIGFPGEHWDEIRETIRYAENCGADYVKIFVAVPLKGTRLWEMAKKTGGLTEDNYKVDWRYSQIYSDEWTPKDVSILRAYEWDRINFATPKKRKRVAELWGLSEAELFRIRKSTRDILEF
jgi:radical SAM superfamily enzyme YgiQ (UPF0313 family)